MTLSPTDDTWSVFNGFLFCVWGYILPETWKNANSGDIILCLYQESWQPPVAPGLLIVVKSCWDCKSTETCRDSGPFLKKATTRHANCWGAAQLSVEKRTYIPANWIEIMIQTFTSDCIFTRLNTRGVFDYYVSSSQLFRAYWEKQLHILNSAAYVSDFEKNFVFWVI